MGVRIIETLLVRVDQGDFLGLIGQEFCQVKSYFPGTGNNDLHRVEYVRLSGRSMGHARIEIERFKGVPYAIALSKYGKDSRNMEQNYTFILVPSPRTKLYICPQNRRNGKKSDPVQGVLPGKKGTGQTD